MQRTPAPSCSRPYRINMFSVGRRRLATLHVQIFRNGNGNPSEVYQNPGWMIRVVRNLKKMTFRNYVTFFLKFFLLMFIYITTLTLIHPIGNRAAFKECDTHKTLKMHLPCHPSYLDFKDTETNHGIIMNVSCNFEPSYREPVPIGCELGIELDQPVKEPGQVSCYTQVAEFKRWKKVKVLTADGRLVDVMERVVVDVTRMYRYQCADTGKYEKEEHIHVDHVFITDKIIITEISLQPKKLINFQE